MGRRSLICERGDSQEWDTGKYVQYKTQRFGTTEDNIRFVQSRHSTEEWSNTHFKNMVKRNLDQVTKDGSFDARKNRTANAAPIRRKVEDRSKSEDGKTIDCRQWLSTGKCFKRESYSFKHDTNKKDKDEDKRDQPSCLSSEPRSQKQRQ